MNRERLEQIGKFLEGRMVVHRNVEHDSSWTTEEKMIQELYDNYLDLLIEYGKQKEVIDKLKDKTKENIKNAKYEITTLTNEEQNKELLKLVKEYPTLPLVFFCSSEDICDDYSYTFMKFRRVEKGVIYESDINDIMYTSEDDYVEDLCDYFADDVRYSNMTDSEYEKEMQKEARKVPHYEAIIIYADA